MWTDRVVGLGHARLSVIDLSEAAAQIWAAWTHDVTIITTAPNFPPGELYPGYKNQTETMSRLRVVRVKTFIAANKGTYARGIDFVSFYLLDLQMPFMKNARISWLLCRLNQKQSNNRIPQMNRFNP